jgi:hypothetical protein
VRATGETAARLNALILLLLLAELHAAGMRNDRRLPWMRTEPAARRPRSRPLVRGSVSGRRPRG